MARENGQQSQRCSSRGSLWLEVELVPFIDLGEAADRPATPLNRAAFPKSILPNADSSI